MLMGYVDGALASFDWYEEAYRDDGGEPYLYLTWALALFSVNRRQEAFNKLYQTMLENLYPRGRVINADNQRCWTA